MGNLADRLRAAGCVYAEEEAALLIAQATGPAELDAMVAQRCAGTPLEYVLGWAEFCGLRIGVTPGVFVPRRRSEVLARQAIGLCRPGTVLLDLCCGTGAIAATVLAGTSRVEVHAADVDPAAVRCAERNLRAEAQVHTGDLWNALPPELLGRIDVVVANAPYIPSGEIPLLPPEARDYEHPNALDGGADGLAVHRRLLAGAAPWLAPGGAVLIESSIEQADALHEAFETCGFRSRATLYADYETAVSVGRLK